MGSRENYFRSVGRQNNNNNNAKSPDRHINEKISINEVAYENDHISLLRDSTLSNVLNFCFYQFYCNRKEKDHIKRKKKVKTNILIREISIIILIHRKSGSVGPV